MIFKKANNMLLDMQKQKNISLRHLLSEFYRKFPLFPILGANREIPIVPFAMWNKELMTKVLFTHNCIPKDQGYSKNAKIKPARKRLKIVNGQGPGNCC